MNTQSFPSLQSQLLSKVASNNSLNLLLEAAVREVLPQAEFFNEEVTPFYFCSEFQSDAPASEDLLHSITLQLKRLLQQDIVFEKKTMVQENAVSFLLHHKQEREASIAEQSIDSLVEICMFGDLLRVNDLPTVHSSREIGEFTLFEIESCECVDPELGAFSLLRVRGASFCDKKALKHFVKTHEKRKKNKAEDLAQTRDLFKTKQELIWLSSGLVIKRIIEKKWGELCKEREFCEVQTPRSLSFSQTQKRAPFLVDPDFSLLYSNPNKSTFISQEDAIVIMPDERHRSLFLPEFREKTIRICELAIREKSEEKKSKEAFFDTLSVYCAPSSMKKELKNILSLIEEMARFLTLSYKVVCFIPEERKQKGSFVKTCQNEIHSFFSACNLAPHYEEVVSQRLHNEVYIEYYFEDERGFLHKCAHVYVKEEVVAKKEAPLCLFVASSFLSLEQVLFELCEKNERLPAHLLPCQVVVLAILDQEGENKKQLQDLEQKKTSNEEIRCKAKALSAMLTKQAIRAEWQEVARECLARQIFEIANKKIPLLVAIGQDEVEKKQMVVRYLGDAEDLNKRQKIGDDQICGLIQEEITKLSL